MKNFTISDVIDILHVCGYFDASCGQTTLIENCLDGTEDWYLRIVVEDSAVHINTRTGQVFFANLKDIGNAPGYPVNTVPELLEYLNVEIIPGSHKHDSGFDYFNELELTPSRLDTPLRYPVDSTS